MKSFTEDDLREMVVRLAHEIRNPLASIKSGVQLAQHLGKPEGEVKECLEEVIDEVNRIDRTVQDLQRYTRLVAGEVASILVAGAVSRTVNRLRVEVERLGKRVIINGDTSCLILANPGHLELALEQLMSNAIRHTPIGEAISVEWGPEAGHLIRVTVRDSGPGVKPGTEERILRPFFSTSTHGTGLGLSFVLKICQLYGGRLEWRNLHPGAEFSILLPEVCDGTLPDR